VRSRLGELAGLEQGEFFCWSPSWLRTFKRVRVLPKWTFDALRTPVIGEGVPALEPMKVRLTGDELEALRSAAAGGPGRRSASASAGPKGLEALEEERRRRQSAESGWRQAQQETARLRRELEQQGQALLGLQAALESLLKC